MFAKGRNVLQLSIDENKDVIERVIRTTPHLIHRYFASLREDAKKTALEISDNGADKEIYFSALDNELSLRRMEDETEMIEVLYNSLTLGICSYAERGMKSMLNKDKDYKRNYLCCLYSDVKRQYCLNLPSIGTLWRGRKNFYKKRNDVAHGRKTVNTSEDDLLAALTGAHHLLRVTADALSVGYTISLSTEANQMLIEKKNSNENQ